MRYPRSMLVATMLTVGFVAACTAPPLTGNWATDCLNARNHVIEMQAGVSNAQKGLAALVILADPKLAPKIEKAQQLLDLARDDLADAIEQRDSLCTAPPPILIEG